MTHYSQERCRLSRDQSILDLGDVPERQVVFSAFSALSFGGVDRFHAAFQRLWVDEIVYLMDWRPFIASSKREWTCVVAVVSMFFLSRRLILIDSVGLPSRSRCFCESSSSI